MTRIHKKIIRTHRTKCIDESDDRYEDMKADMQKASIRLNSDKQIIVKNIATILKCSESIVVKTLEGQWIFEEAYNIIMELYNKAEKNFQKQKEELLTKL